TAAAGKEPTEAAYWTLATWSATPTLTVTFTGADREDAPAQVVTKTIDTTGVSFQLSVPIAKKLVRVKVQNNSLSQDFAVRRVSLWIFPTGRRGVG
ncbi:MAG TPA: hypothetical protein VNA25_24260, partial [Phycisphaerae bacterium]|nr:hypothetical protein [Phycisphaerae bacterium]